MILDNVNLSWFNDGLRVYISFFSVFRHGWHEVCIWGCERHHPAAEPPTVQPGLDHHVNTQPVQIKLHL